MGSVDRILLGLVNQPSQRRDEFITEELTNHLFQIPGFSFGMDLASINIQRGRDHGLAPYVDWREPCGISPVKTWKDLERVTSVSIARNFRRIYDTIEDIDLYSAGLAEKPVVGGLVGPTFACIIAQQFSNLRKGDRFWYENPHSENALTPPQLEQIRRVSLAKILCKTLDNIETIQPFVFLTVDTLRNRRVSCNDARLGQLDLKAWIGGKAKVDIPLKSEEALKPQNTVTETTKAPPKERPISSEAKMLPWQRFFKPIKTNVNQKNRIIVKRPIFSQDNVTIVVQNHAVNSPVFVTDTLYNSHLQGLEQLPWRPQRPPVSKPPLSHLPQINYPGSQPSLTQVNDQSNYPYPGIGSGGFTDARPPYSGATSPYGVNPGYQTGGDISLGGSSFGYHTAHSPPVSGVADYLGASGALGSYGQLGQPVISSYPAGTRPYVPSYFGYQPHGVDPDDPNPKESSTSTSRPRTHNDPQIPYPSHGYHHYQTSNDWLKPIYRSAADGPAFTSSSGDGKRANSDTVGHKEDVNINHDLPQPFANYFNSKSQEELPITTEKYVNDSPDFTTMMRDSYSSSNELPRPLIRAS